MLATDPTVARQAVRAVRALQTDYARWARQCYRIRDKTGLLRLLVLNPVQRAIGEAEAEMLRTTGQARLYILKARQGGVTTDQQARNLHQIWREPGFDALTLAHTQGDTEKIFGITRRAIEHFPASLLPALGEKATNEVSFPGLDAHFFTGTAGSKRMGRGLTLKRFHGSEFAFWEDPMAVLGTVTPALVPNGSVAALETTASGFDSEAHVFWREAEGRGYRPLFFPWWQCDPRHYRLPLLAPDELGTLEPDEAALVAEHGLDLEQIKWRRAKLAELGRTMFLTEFAEDAESCWAAPGGMFYDADVLRVLTLRAPTPLSTGHDGALEVYGDPEEGERVIIGCDTAEGGGGDRSTFVARAFPSWRLLVSYASRHVEPEGLADLLNTWGRAFDRALLVVEKNAHGITVLRTLRDKHKYPAARLYHRIAPDRDRTEDGKSERLGWVTNAETKPLLLDAGRQLIQAAIESRAGVPSTAALRDAMSVRRNDRGTGDLGSRDVWVAECLAWMGRSYPVFTLMLGRA